METETVGILTFFPDCQVSAGGLRSGGGPVRTMEKLGKPKTTSQLVADYAEVLGVERIRVAWVDELNKKRIAALIQVTQEALKKAREGK